MAAIKSRLGRTWSEIKRERPVDPARIEEIKAKMRTELAS